MGIQGEKSSKFKTMFPTTRACASPKMGWDPVSWEMSVPCRHAIPVTVFYGNPLKLCVLWKPLEIVCSMETPWNCVFYGNPSKLCVLSRNPSKLGNKVMALVKRLISGCHFIWSSFIMSFNICERDNFILFVSRIDHRHSSMPISSIIILIQKAYIRKLRWPRNKTSIWGVSPGIS